MFLIRLVSTRNDISLPLYPMHSFHTGLRHQADGSPLMIGSCISPVGVSHASTVSMSHIAFGCHLLHRRNPDDCSAHANF
jgi:hypothetical protein